MLCLPLVREWAYVFVTTSQTIMLCLSHHHVHQQVSARRTHNPIAILESMLCLLYLVQFVSDHRLRVTNDLSTCRDGCTTSRMWVLLESKL